jgi:hypothetical protein
MSRVYPNQVVNKLDSKKAYAGINWESVQAQVDRIRMIQAQEALVPFEEVIAEKISVDNMDTVKNYVSELKLNGATAEEVHNLITACQNDEVCVKIAAAEDEGRLDLLKEISMIPKPEKKNEFDIATDNMDEEIKLAANLPPLVAESEKIFKSPQSPNNKEEFFQKMDKKLSSKKETTMKKQSNITPKVQTKRVVAFTSAEQLSAAAIEEAKRKGDEKLVNTILDARHQRRLHVASQIEKMRNTRVAETGAQNTRVAQSETMQEKHVQAEQVLAEEFKSVNELQDNEKLAFARVASKYGFPNEYVSYMLNGGNDPSDEAMQIVELIKTENLSVNAKAAAVKSLIKTAELSQGDLSYLKNYWLNVLGYDDPSAKEYVEALFTSKLYKKIGDTE